MTTIARTVAAFVLLATPSLADVPDVMADTPVTGSLVQQVMGDLGQVRVLLPAGASPHSYQMRPSDAQALQSSDLLVWTGPELTPWLTRAAGAVAGDAAELRLLTVPGTALQSYGPAGEAHRDHDHGDSDDHAHHDHADHDDHAHHDDHAQEGHDHHDHTGTDPHAWLNPDNAAPWLSAIAASLSELDPDHAEDYAANAQAAAETLAALDAELARDLAPVAGDHIIVFHDAYGYFTRHYGLMPAIAVSLGDATSPSAARIAEVRDRMAQTGARCAFPEQGHDPKLIESLIEGSDIRMGNTLAPEGSAQEQGPGLYGAMLRGMADTLTECLTQG